MTDLNTEQRLYKLEAEVDVIKKNMLHRDEVREKVWNDLQRGLLHLVREDHEYIKRVDERTLRLECKLEVMQKDMVNMQSDIADMKRRMDRLESGIDHLESDVAEIKAMLRQALRLE
ncbi:hypothetical protein [Endozoicomonas sp. Mp262]|uniref:hypothetical protein n=1 Tax=Endozoicomonas sp. Mp262 TaxID=2919499 RepID=UPI0021DB0710